jgi:motility quorum-sensing regulator/GCU-specific mRNA interferase toxin
MQRRGPTCPLKDIQRRVLAGTFAVTQSAEEGAALLGFDQSDIVACVLALTTNDFYKTMQSERKPWLWQDVYNPVYLDKELFVKLQISVGGSAVVISFKEL